MTVTKTPPPTLTARPLPSRTPPGADAAPAGLRRTSRAEARRARRAERRLLREADLAAARRAELHHMQEALRGARELVDRGWVQGAWLRVGTADGRTRTVTSGALDLVDPRVVTGACLVGAVVQGGGGPGGLASTTSAQLVRRTLDAVWQTGFAHETRPGRSCAPAVLRSRVRDLTRWNDARGRSAGEVSALLARTEDRVRVAAGA